MPNLEETTPRLRRSIIVRALLRALLTATLLVVLYYVVQMLLDLILLGFGARAVLGAVNLGRQRQGPRQPK